MGGHQSKQSVSDSVSAVGSAVQSVTQSCINYVNAENVIAIDGSGNVVGGVTQSLAISVDSKCSGEVTQDASFENNLANSVAQELHDQEVSMTQWLDNSGDTSSDAIKQSVSTNVTATTVQTCLNSINSQNILNVSGSGNIVKGVVQSGTVNLLSQCMLGQGQTSSTVNDITNTVNQHSVYDSENPLAFITDSIEAVMKTAVGAIAVVFILLICFVGLFVALRHWHREDRAAAAAPAPAPAPGAASPAAASPSAAR